MAPSKKTPQTKTDFAQELERAQEYIEKLTNEIASLKDTLQQTKEEKAKLFQKNAEMEKSLSIAYDKIKAMDPVTAKQGTGETAREGFVELATVPFNGNYPPQGKIGGILIPRKRDEDGILYESVPVSVAVARLNVKNAYKRYFMGPGDSIEGTVPVSKGGATYSSVVKFNRHKKVKRDDGTVEFVEVFVEESQPKA